MTTTQQIFLILAVIETCLMGVWLCKVVDVHQARMQRIKRMRQQMDVMREHNSLMLESSRLRSKQGD